jgi:hypothetical protein
LSGLSGGGVVEMKEGGFVLSLDAVFALLLTTMLIASAVKLVPPSLSYQEHGYERLSRFASDALLCLEQGGSLSEAIGKLTQRVPNLGEAELILRENLRSLLPPYLQFRIDIGLPPHLQAKLGMEKLTVYPDDSPAWPETFENLEEVAACMRVTTDFVVLENLRILAWVDDPDENTFLENIHTLRPNWIIIRTNNETFFRDLISKLNENTPHVILLPDVNRSFERETRRALETGNRNGWFGVVGGGATFINNNTREFQRIFAATLPRREPFYYTRSEDIQIVDNTHYLTENFRIGENIPYLDNMPQYRYQPRPTRDTPVYVLAQSYWNGGRRRDNSAILAKDALRQISPGVYRRERAVLFNTHFVESATQGAGENQWLTLVIRALEWSSRKKPEFEPVTLYVWRGPHA